MANKEQKRNYLVAKRAMALATMHLTRRPDLVVTEEGAADLGLDLLVRIVRDDRDGVRQFGVEVRAAWASVSRGNANGVLRPAFHQLNRSGPFPFPVVLFFFTMEEEQAWFSWVVEPVVTPQGKAVLRPNREPDCRLLDAAVLDAAVEHIDRWFDAFYAGLIATSAEGG